MLTMDEIEKQLREIKHSLAQMPQQLTGIYKEIEYNRIESERRNKEQNVAIASIQAEVKEVLIKIDGDDTLDVVGLRKRLAHLEIAYKTGQKFWWKATGFFAAFAFVVIFAKACMWVYDSWQKIK